MTATNGDAHDGGKPYTVHHRYMFYYVMRGGEMIEKFVWEEDAQALANMLNKTQNTLKGCCR